MSKKTPKPPETISTSRPTEMTSAMAGNVWLLTWTTYGTWLPGDSRGFVGYVHDPTLAQLKNPLTGVNGSNEPTAPVVGSNTNAPQQPGRKKKGGGA